MQRTTVSLTEPVATALAREARRRSVSASQIVRESLSETLGLGDAEGVRPLPFPPLGQSGRSDTSERVDEILAAEWGEDARSR